MEKLKNGALVLERGTHIGPLGAKQIVLAKWGKEYVTWAIDDKLNAYWGHYFQRNLRAALNDYEKRVTQG